MTSRSDLLGPRLPGDVGGFRRAVLSEDTEDEDVSILQYTLVSIGGSRGYGVMTPQGISGLFGPQNG